jgi:D-proline reductase (dithiol) PrdB
MGPVDYIPRIRDNYARLGYKAYNWVFNRDTAPWAPLRKPLSQCRLGLAASGGIYAAGQVAFHHKDDTSLREIPTDIGAKELRATHFAYDLSGARTDPNVVFPIDPLRRLVRDGFLGGLSSRFYTFMGGIYSSRRVTEDLAPRLTARFLEDGVDAVLLVPV